MILSRSSASAVGIVILTVACNSEPDNESSASREGMETVARYNESSKPEGISGPNEAVTQTYYIPHAALGDMYELSAAKIALARTHNPDVRLFAEAMLVDHQRTSEAIKDFVDETAVNIALPQNLDDRHEAMLKNLRSASDAQFDHVYLGQQAAAHQKAYYLHKSYATNGANEDLAKVAGRIASIVQKHRERLEKLQQQTPGKD